MLFHQLSERLLVARQGRAESLVLQRQLQARARALVGDRPPHRAAERRLRLADRGPYPALKVVPVRCTPHRPRPFAVGRAGTLLRPVVERNPAGLRRQARGGRRELALRLGTAPFPPALLHAERADGNVAGPRRHDHADGQHAVLLAALDDVARLDEDLPVARIADDKLLDVAGFEDPDGALLHRLAEGQGHGAVTSFRAVNQVDGEAVVGVGAAQAVVVLCRSRRARRENAGGQNGGGQESEPLHVETLLSGIVQWRAPVTWCMRQRHGGIAAESRSPIQRRILPSGNTDKRIFMRMMHRTLLGYNWTISGILLIFQEKTNRKPKLFLWS